MFRGVSLAPQQRVVKDPQALPSELVQSIIGVSAHPSPDYGATSGMGGAGGGSGRTDGAALLSTAGQPLSGANGGGNPSLLTRLFRSARRRYQPNVAGQVPVFDANGRLTTSQTGVNTFRFRSLSLFYFFRAQPWTALITYSILIYLLIVLLITLTYYVWGMYCGAGMNVVASVYFTVVSLAANGGYMGEDDNTMIDPTHLCYRGRTLIVMVCSYVNIVFVGLVAALVVGKAEYTGKLGHRVVFSEFCTLTSVPGRVGQYRLSFRMANVENNVPLAHGRLRLFCVTAEPLREYRFRQKQMQLLKNSAPLKTLARAATWGSAHQLLPGGEATNTVRGAAAASQPLTEAMLEGRRASHQSRHHPHHHHRAQKQQKQQQQAQGSGRPPLPDGGALSPVTAAAAARRLHPADALAPPRSSSGVEKNAQPARAAQQQQSRQRNRRGKKGDKTAAAAPTLPNTSVANLATAAAAAAGAPASGSGSGSRRRRGRGAAPISPDHGAGSHSGDSRTSSPASSDTRTLSSHSGSSQSSSRSSSSSSSSSSSTASASRPSPQLEKTLKAASGSLLDDSSKTVDALAVTNGAASDITNSSMTSKENSELYAASPLAGAATGSFAGPSAGRGAAKTTAATAAAAAAAAARAVKVPDDHDECEMERVHLRVQEMRWTCAEELFLDHGDSGQLSLWYPATITHTIDERSPLYSFMQLPSVAASLQGGPMAAPGSARSNDSSVHPPSLGNNMDMAQHRFQLVAVFDATEMETGSTITAKRTYTTVDIVAHYKFSDRLVHMHPESQEVMLDFHYFNALLPVHLVELSTTDSEM